MNDLLTPCDALEPGLRAICRGEDPRVPRCDVNLNRANGFAGRTPPLPPLMHCAHQPPPQPTAIAPAGSPPPPAPTPPLVIRGWNFASAMARWALAGMPRRTKAEIDARLAICQSCEFLQNDHCTKCGCACVEQNRLINKLALATEKCPVGKWK